MSWVQGSGPSAKTETSKQRATKATAPAGNALQRKANGVRARIEAAYTIPDTVQKRSLLQSYMVLPMRTRMAISLTLAGIGFAGMYGSSLLEQALPADEESQQRRKDAEQSAKGQR